MLPLHLPGVANWGGQKLVRTAVSHTKYCFANELNICTEQFCFVCMNSDKYANPSLNFIDQQ
jgi:hypothetical protein